MIDTVSSFIAKVFAFSLVCFVLGGCQKINEVPPAQKSIDGLQIKLPEPTKLTAEQYEMVRTIREEYETELRK